MDKLLFEAINNYYGTAVKTGYLPLSTIKKLIVLDFVSDLVNEEHEISCEDRYLISKLYNCITENNCLL